MPDRDPEAETEQEIRETASQEPHDPITVREELEKELMDEWLSEVGTELGDEMG